MSNDSSKLAFGIIQNKLLNLQPDELIGCIEKKLECYSYDPKIQTDFKGLFKFIAQRFESVENNEIVMRAVSVLSNIGGYRLGISVASLLELISPLTIRLLSDAKVEYVKSAVDFYRKVGRILGPRYIFNSFIEPNTGNESMQRSLAVIVHQLINDNPKFDFLPEDFGDGIKNLSNLVGVGPRLANSIKQRVDIAEFDNIEPVDQIPIPLPRKHNRNSLNQMISLKSKETDDCENHLPPKLLTQSSSPNSLFTKMKSQYSRTLPLTSSTRPNTHGPIFQLTPRQQQIRKFNDSPFEESENIREIVNSVRRGITSKEWDERCSSFNLARRVLKYSTDSFNEDDVHAIVTASLEDVVGVRAALSLSAIGAIEELFINKTEVMEMELARVLPVLLKLHAKTAQFFESSLQQCCDIIVNSMPSKRFCSVMISIGESKSPKVQAAMANLYCKSITKCNENKEKFFSKASDEFVNIIKIVNNFLDGSLSPIRESGRDIIHQLYLLYEDDLTKAVHKTLVGNDANRFLQHT